MHLDPIDGDQLAHHMVETLPDVPGARVRPITITSDDYNTEAGFADPLAEPGPAQQQAARLRELIRAERDAVHQIYAAIRDNHGRRRSVPVSVLDLSHHGRVATFLSGGDRGQDIINLVPGTPAKLIAVLEATIDGL